MGDMFDEDLIRELGLDPSELQPAGDKPAAQPQKTPPPAAKPPAKSEVKAAPPASRTPPPAAPIPENKAPVASAKPAGAKAPPQSVEDYGNALSQDIPVQLAAVIAKKSLKIRDVLDMQLGEVIDFKKSTQEPIDLVVNGKLVAKAELVVIEGRLGARIVKLVK